MLHHVNSSVELEVGVAKEMQHYKGCMRAGHVSWLAQKGNQTPRHLGQDNAEGPDGLERHGQSQNRDAVHVDKDVAPCEDPNGGDPQASS